MKTFIIAAAFVALTAGAASANPCTNVVGSNCNAGTNQNVNTQNNSQSQYLNNSNKAYGGNGGAGGQGGAGGSGGAGGNSSATGGNASGQSVNIDTPHQAPAIANSLAMSGQCSGEGFSLGASGPLGGITGGYAGVEANCRKDIHIALGWNSGDPAVQKEQKLTGEAELARAQQNRQIAVNEAEAKKDAAVLLAEAEVERAKGVVAANKIIAEGLGGPEGYLRYLWIQTLENSNNKVIYVPTEGNLPLLEAGRLHVEPAQ